VVTPEGRNYERKNIEQYMKKNSNKHPVTGDVLRSNDLIPNTALKDFMKVFKGGEWGKKVCNVLKWSLMVMSL